MARGRLHPLSGLSDPHSLQSLRLAFRRAFIAYFLDLNRPVIADPTNAFATARDYMAALHEQLGAEEFMRRLDDETTGLAGQIEQDVRHAYRGKPAPDFSELEDRLRECIEYALAQIDTSFTQPG